MLMPEPGWSAFDAPMVPRSGQARFLRAEGIIVHTTIFVHPGRPVRVPLETIDGEQVMQTGVVASCDMIAARRHRTEIRFSVPLVPEHFVVCWGLAVGDEGHDPSDYDALPVIDTDPDPMMPRAPTPGSQSPEMEALRRRCASIADSLRVAAESGSSADRLASISDRAQQCVEKIRRQAWIDSQT